MRVFSDFERTIIEELIDGYHRTNYVNDLNNLFTMKPELGPKSYFLTSSSAASKSLVFTYGIKEQIDVDSGSAIDLFIMQLLELFEYLQSNNLITLVPLNRSAGEYSIGKEKPEHAMRLDSLPDGFRVKLYPYTASIFFISQSLINYVNNGYKTLEDLKHDEQMGTLSDQLTHTKKAFWLSFSALVLSIIVSAASVSINLWGKTTVKVEEMPYGQIPSELQIISETLKNISRKHVDISQSLMEISNDQKKVSENLERISPFHNHRGE